MKSHGFALISAILILVLFSLLSTYLINIYGILQYTSSNSFRSNKAYFAARSGLDWGIFQIVQSSNGPCFTEKTILMNQAGLDKFTTKVSCDSISFVEGNNNFQVYTITSKGYMGNRFEQDYVFKQISTVITRGKPQV